MGAKYEMLFLSDADNKNILTIISNIMDEFGWHYNKLSLGKYSYWSSPIWKFESSKEVTEYEIDKNDNICKLTNIIEHISQFYSQSIVFHKLINGKAVQIVTSIVESPNLIWKEVGISFELYDLLVHNKNKHTVSSEVKEIFIDISTDLKPFYGKADIEMRGLVDEPERFKIEEVILGNFNYFSFKCPGIERLNNIAIDEKYEIYDYDNIGRFILTNKHISEY